ncbi:hypothetical protein NL676_014194 [Syzygium grande]|nr:hypothetical protein NL676_014194 [Syzygium grande]
MSYDKELAIAKKVASLAASLCQKVQKELLQSDVQSKSDKSPVTVADYGSQAIVRFVLERELSDEPLSLVAEEDQRDLRKDSGKDTLQRITKLVNETISIDGSYGTSTLSPEDVLRAIDSGKSEGGSLGRHWVLDPIDVNVQVPVSDIGNSEEASFFESLEKANATQYLTSSVARKLGVKAPPVGMDSQVKYGALSRGDGAIYMRLHHKKYTEKILDHAAGCIIVTEAGGVVTDAAGQPLDFSKGRYLDLDSGIIATNEKLMPSLLKAVILEPEHAKEEHESVSIRQKRLICLEFDTREYYEDHGGFRISNPRAENSSLRAWGPDLGSQLEPNTSILDHGPTLEDLDDLTRNLNGCPEALKIEPATSKAGLGTLAPGPKT